MGASKEAGAKTFPRSLDSYGDAEKGFLELKVSEEELAGREPARPSLEAHRHGMGRELFGVLRRDLAGAEEGASSIFSEYDE